MKKRNALDAAAVLNARWAILMSANAMASLSRKKRKNSSGKNIMIAFAGIACWN